MLLPRQVAIQLLERFGEGEPPKAKADVTIAEPEAATGQQQDALLVQQPLAELPRRTAAQADQGHRPGLGPVPAEYALPPGKERLRQGQVVLNDLHVPRSQRVANAERDLGQGLARRAGADGGIVLPAQDAVPQRRRPAGPASRRAGRAGHRSWTARRG